MKRALPVSLFALLVFAGCSEGFSVPGQGPQWEPQTFAEADSDLIDPEPEEFALTPTWSTPLPSEGPLELAAAKSGVLVLSAPGGSATVSLLSDDATVEWSTEVDELGSLAVLGGSPNGAAVVAGVHVNDRSRVDVIRLGRAGKRKWTSTLPEYATRLSVLSVSALDDGVVAVLSQASERDQQIGVLDFIDAEGGHLGRETIASETNSPLAVLGSGDELTVFSEFPEDHPQDGERLSTHVRIYDATGLLQTAGPRSIEFTGAWAVEDGALMGGIVDAELSCVIDAHPYRTSDASMKESPFPNPVASLEDWILALDDGDVLLGRGDENYRFESPELQVTMMTRAADIDGAVFALGLSGSRETAQLLRFDVP